MYRSENLRRNRTFRRPTGVQLTDENEPVHNAMAHNGQLMLCGEMLT